MLELIYVLYYNEPIYYYGSCGQLTMFDKYNQYMLFPSEIHPPSSLHAHLLPVVIWGSLSPPKAYL